jgi:hypothetical protein
LSKATGGKYLQCLRVPHGIFWIWILKVSHYALATPSDILVWLRAARLDARVRLGPRVSSEPMVPRLACDNRFVCLSGVHASRIANGGRPGLSLCRSPIPRGLCEGVRPLANGHSVAWDVGGSEARKGHHQTRGGMSRVFGRQVTVCQHCFTHLQGLRSHVECSGLWFFFADCLLLFKKNARLIGVAVPMWCGRCVVECPRGVVVPIRRFRGPLMLGCPSLIADRVAHFLGRPTRVFICTDISSMRAPADILLL